MLWRKRSQKWKKWSIYDKTTFMLVIMVLILCMLVFFIIGSFQHYRRDTNDILKEHASISSFLTTFSTENTLLDYQVRGVTNSITLPYEQAKLQTDTILEQLTPKDKPLGSESYLLCRAIQNAMKHYRLDEKKLLDTIATHKDYIKLYYSLRTQASYIDQYAKSLLRVSVRNGSQQFRSLTSQMGIFYGVLFFLLLLSVTVVVFTCIMLLYSIVAPLTAISAAATSFHAGNLDTPDVIVHQSGEIGALADAFNTMKKRVNEAFHEISEKAAMEQRLRQHEQKESQMRQLLEERRFSQLQSQIHPHFLFNTLTTISSMARIERAVVTEDLIVRLSKLLRYSLETGEKLVPLRQEIQIVNDYMELQEARFGGRFVFEVLEKETLGESLIPKFTIQPLAENAVIHGMRNRQFGGRIRLTVQKYKSKYIRIFVTDNGCGFKEIQHGKNQSVGVKNIQQRMFIFGGDFHIFSVPGLGTTACLTIPRKENI